MLRAEFIDEDFLMLALEQNVRRQEAKIAYAFHSQERVRIVYAVPVHAGRFCNCKKIAIYNMCLRSKKNSPTVKSHLRVFNEIYAYYMLNILLDFLDCSRHTFFLLQSIVMAQELLKAC